MSFTSRREERALGLDAFSEQSTLKAACDAYLERRQDKLRPRSVEAYKYHFRTLQGYFDPDQRLITFHEGHLVEYQKRRTAAGAGPSLINHEIGALAQLLDLAGLWHPISKYYERLPERNWAPPKIMTPEEEERFLRVGRKNPAWKTALNSALLTGNTTLAGCGLRTLQLKNIRLDSDPPMILVPATVKNKNRVVGIPLNETALAAVRELIAQARDRGAWEPNHYLIPLRIKKGLFDPDRAASPCFIRSAFHSIRRTCGLNWVTPTTFRHQAITKLLERGAPDETVRAIAGHGTEKAMKYYSHIRIHAKKQALDKLQPAVSVKRAKRARATRRFLLLDAVRASAEQLGVSADAALELILAYERSKVEGI